MTVTVETFMKCNLRSVLTIAAAVALKMHPSIIIQIARDTACGGNWDSDYRDLKKDRSEHLNSFVNGDGIRDLF